MTSIVRDFVDKHGCFFVTKAPSLWTSVFGQLCSGAISHRAILVRNRTPALGLVSGFVLNFLPLAVDCWMASILNGALVNPVFLVQTVIFGASDWKGLS